MIHQNRNLPSAFSLLLCLGTALLAPGCTTSHNTSTARSATEQLLLSTAADHALREPNLNFLAGRRVYLDTSYFDSYDSKYALGSVRDVLSRAGALLEDNATNSDIIVEVRSGALAIDASDTMFGIPSITFPLPLSGPVQTPEIALYKSDLQRSTAKFALLAIGRESRAHIYSSGSLDGKAHVKHSRLLFVSWRRTDVPEKYTDLKDVEHYQTWIPKYDSQNLPPATGTNQPK